MKARFRYRIYPDRPQRLMLAKIFGCVRVVCNDAIRLRQDLCNPGDQVGDIELQKRVIIPVKATVECGWLSKVESVLLVQSLQDICLAFRNFFKSLKDERKGRKTGLLQFKKKHSTQSIRFITKGFLVKPNSVYLAKIGCVRVRGVRELLSDPSLVTIIKDAVDRYFASLASFTNIQIQIQVVGGQSETQNGRGGRCKSSSLVAANQVSTHGLVKQLRLLV